ncbi:hypothetical protein [Pelagibacterium limicola]|uniref:hypothetical protein n=1 Tax=Pelagibacterium limicola TaxID=2791022 RepID=UPI0018AFD327|nr:hypothetical protein [Pelagibacterium limicola]
MQLVGVFLPLDTKHQTPIAPDVFEGIFRDLAHRFGGATAFSRAPAQGLWNDEGLMKSDRLIIVEVMVEDVDESWWKDYRLWLKSELEQDEIIIRATPCRRL